QIDKTAEALAALDREVREYVARHKPPAEAEVSNIQATTIRSQAGAYATGRAVLATTGGIVRYDRPRDRVFQRNAMLEGLSVAQVKQAATTLEPDKLVWVVVGDLKRVELPVRSLELGPVQVIDGDGNPVKR